eukprot:CAMPEP_0181403872 /NCGR_PEP_ID=MMETSP1110-20121109/3944_1 /TAXON_ID=174948 /ORGANISM="Symbiodinium sp., Strain CCMP421" /LENGTH=137 /DNA_ID=CAMNT_0023526195 /DNA_START=268 /DNA_END=679 /DNA_ORIENTATION=-
MAQLSCQARRSGSFLLQLCSQRAHVRLQQPPTPGGPRTAEAKEAGALRATTSEGALPREPWLTKVRGEELELEPEPAMGESSERGAKASTSVSLALKLNDSAADETRGTSAGTSASAEASAETSGTGASTKFCLRSS